VLDFVSEVCATDMSVTEMVVTEVIVTERSASGSIMLGPESPSGVGAFVADRVGERHTTDSVVLRSSCHGLLPKSSVGQRITSQYAAR
jgi:hypothetical protein